MKIGVIGAGAAGLSAAYDLTKAGHKVTVYESAPFIGGQASTIEVGGGRLERGYHHLFINDEDIIDLMAEIGLKDNLKWFKSKVGTYVNGKVYKTTTPLDLLKFSALPILDRLRMGLFVLRLKSIKDWKSLESKTADEWLRERLGGNAYTMIWQPLLRGKFGDYFDQIGMPWFWGKMQTRFASRKRSGGERLGYPIYSFDEIFSTLKREIESGGGYVFLETPVKGILTDGGVTTGVRFCTPDGIEHEENFDVVLSTVPSFEFVKIVDLPKTYVDQLTGVVYTAAVVLILELSHQLTDMYWMNIADRSLPFLGLIEHTNLVPKDWYGGRHVLYLTNYVDRKEPLFEMSPSELLDLYLPHLKKFNNNFKSSWVQKTHYNRLSAAQPIIGTNYSEKIPHHRTPIKRLYLANTTQIYPEDRGTNYSVRLGRNLAKMIISDGDENFETWLN